MGSRGVRVVDASVIPIITNGNIYAPTMMIAERAADAILGNDMLPPLDVDLVRSASQRLKRENQPRVLRLG